MTFDVDPRPNFAAMIRNYKVFTVTHKELNTQDLSNFVIKHENEQDLATKLNELKALFDQEEVLYLTTCNRVLFLFYGHRDFNREDTQSLFHHINPSLEDGTYPNLSSVIMHFSGLEAVNHIFEVCSSIESLVVGEREIFRQFKEAYKLCKRIGVCGDNIRLVEKSAVKAAKEVYTHTEIGAKPVSVVSLSIQEFLKKELPATARILLIGAGETNTSAGKLLNKNGYSNIVIFNRSLDNALALSKEIGAKAYHLKDLAHYEDGFDCIIASTNAQEAIIDEGLFDTLRKNESDKLVIDLSIPCNIQLSSIQQSRNEYVNIDSIRKLAAENMAARSGNISAARIILATHLSEFSNMYDRRRVERVFADLPEAIGEIKDRALNNIYKSEIDALPDSTKSLVHDIVEYMEKKYVAVPMKIAKKGMA